MTPQPGQATRFSLFLWLLLLVCPACASLSGEGRTYTLLTTPSDAEVFSAKGDLVGKSPLTLTSEKLHELAPEGVLALRVKKHGFFPLETRAFLSSVITQEVKLQPLEENLFSSEILPHYINRLNRFGRDLLEAQGLLALKKMDLAEKALEKLSKEYAGLPVVMVLRANLLLLQGNNQEAESLLQQAAELTPDDPTLQRLLQRSHTTSSDALPGSRGPKQGKP